METRTEKLSKALPIIDWVMASCDRQYFTEEIIKSVKSIFGNIYSSLRQANIGYSSREDGHQPAKQLYYAWRLNVGMVALEPINRAEALYDLLMTEEPILVTPNTNTTINGVLQKGEEEPIDMRVYMECVKLCALFIPEKYKSDIESGKFAKSSRFHFDKSYEFCKEKHPKSYNHTKEELDENYEADVRVAYVEDDLKQAQAWNFPDPEVS